MPLYYFHVHDRADLRDEDGTELPCIVQARTEAVRLAGNLIADQAETFWDEAAWSMDVADGTGRVLFSLNFAAVERPRPNCAPS